MLFQLVLQIMNFLHDFLTFLPFCFHIQFLSGRKVLKFFLLIGNLFLNIFTYGICLLQSRLSRPGHYSVVHPTDSHGSTSCLLI